MVFYNRWPFRRFRGRHLDNRITHVWLYFIYVGVKHVWPHYLRDRCPDKSHLVREALCPVFAF